MTVSIDHYLAELSAHLHVSRRARARIQTEVRDHLHDAVARLTATGATPEGAAEQAVAAFGTPAELAVQFNVETGTQAMRRAPLIALSAGLAVFGGLVLAASTQPRGGTSNATVVVQVAFFAAVVAFQIAFVAGACAASRTAALWRRTCAPVDDRVFVRRCTAIAVGALAAAAAGWAAVAGLSVAAMAHPDTLTASIGIAVMITAALGGALAVIRLRVNPADAPDDTDARDASASTGFLGIGERGIDLVRRYPVFACGVAAAISAAAAMSHAETTLMGALPWGIAQLVTVAAAFTLLGPPLALRSRPAPD